jgi:virginiamycin B lyase
MVERSRIALTLIGSVALASGCTNGTSGTAVPPAVSVARNETSPAKVRDFVKIREFADLPQYGSSYYHPSAVTAGPDGELWVTDTIDQDFGDNVVVAIATSGVQQHAYYYTGLATQGASFQDIAEGSDGALWITDEYNGQIVRMTKQGAYTGFLLQNYSAPGGIAGGPDKALWFTQDSGTRGPGIGRITTNGHMKVYSVPAYALDITAGPDGALWFTEPRNDRIGRITTRGKITEYSRGITAGSEPYSIASGPDGALWFTERAGGRIGRITTAGKVTEYSRGVTPTEHPFDLAAGPDGAVWFTEYETYGSYQTRAAKIGRITMQGQINEYSKGLDPRAAPTGIAAGPDGRIWFVESFTDRTGRVRI